MSGRRVGLEKRQRGAGAGAGAGGHAGDGAGAGATAHKRARRRGPRPTTLLTVLDGADATRPPRGLARSFSSDAINATGGFGSRVCVRGDTVVTSTGVFQPGYVLIGGNGNVVSVTKAPPSDVGKDAIMRAHTVIPGFVDIHNHGVGLGTGREDEDVTQFWAQPHHTCAQVVKHGTTSMLATVTFPGGPGTELESDAQAALDALALAVGKVFPACAVVEGVHAEGPCVCDLGGLPPSTYNAMSRKQFEAFADSIPRLKMMTISPSAGAATSEDRFGRIRALCERNVVVALGHDRGKCREDVAGAMRVVAEYGQRAHVTHMFNVTSFHHRDSGLTNIGLLASFPALPLYAGLTPPTIELINDAVHVSADAIELALTAKPLADVMCVSDAISVPVPGRKFEYCGRKVNVSGDGSKVELSASGVVAGSCRNLHFAFQRLVRVHKRTLSQAVQLCCTNPAKRASLHHVGDIVAGRRADLVLLDAELAIEAVLVAGVTAFCRDPAKLMS